MLPVIKTERLIVRFLTESEAPLALNYFCKNKDHLSSSMPTQKESFFELPHWQRRIQKNISEFENGESCRFFVLHKDEGKVIGTVNFTEFIRGVYQGCFLGYGIDKNYEGLGLMTEALGPVIKYVFDELNIHKVLANYMPSNKGSGRVLEKLGFHEVGLAKEELFLSGKWQDHIETRLINLNWKNTINN